MSHPHSAGVQTGHSLHTCCLVFNLSVQRLILGATEVGADGDVRTWTVGGRDAGIQFGELIMRNAIRFD